MRKLLLTTLATIALGTSLMASNTNSVNQNLVKIDNEILHCSLIPQKIWERDKWLVNLNDNVIITCDNYLYSVKNKSWYIKTDNGFNKLSNSIDKFNRISSIYKDMR